MKPSMKRRSLLKTFAGLAAAQPLAGLFRDAIANEAPPLRLVVLWSPHGYAPNFWRPRMPDGSAAGETGWTLSFDPDSSLGPLERHKDSLILCEGLDLTCLYKPGASGMTGHGGGAIAPLTGRDARSAQDKSTTGASLDKFIADLVKVKPFLFKIGGYAGGATSASFDGRGERVPFPYDLAATYREWFATVPATATTSSAPPAQAHLAQQQAERSVVAFLKGEAGVLRSRLAGAERRKLESHLEALNLIEQRVNTLSQPAARMTARCASPGETRPTSDDAATHRAVFDMVTAAFACGLTRVATVPLNGGSYMPQLDLGGPDRHVHNDIAHGYRPEDEASGRYLSRVQRWYSEQVAQLFDALKSVEEGGKTLYDHTIVLWVNELGDPARHGSNNVPFILGGGGGAFRRGRYLRFNLEGGNRGPQDPHNRLLVSVANQFGAGVETFGDPEFKGELAGLT